MIQKEHIRAEEKDSGKQRPEVSAERSERKEDAVRNPETRDLESGCMLA